MNSRYTYREALVATYGLNMTRLSTEQKVAVFQAIENQMAAEQGRTPATVISETMPGCTRGYYAHYDGVIALNEALMDNSVDGGACLVPTVVHEGRHRYQNLCIEGSVQHGNASEVESWVRNSKAYIRPEKDFLGYTAQPLEQSAREYSAGRCAAMEAERSLAVASQRDVERHAERSRDGALAPSPERERQAAAEAAHIFEAVRNRTSACAGGRTIADGKSMQFGCMQERDWSM
ncbi:MAG: hypothetical protein IJ087_04710 [Eggerthellaceae bacterium]|nr:hypothetical protein [Eggerthellaceae bacterium]